MGRRVSGPRASQHAPQGSEHRKPVVGRLGWTGRPFSQADTTHAVAVHPSAPMTGILLDDLTATAGLDIRKERPACIGSSWQIAAQVAIPF